MKIIVKNPEDCPFYWILRDKELSEDLTMCNIRKRYESPCRCVGVYAHNCPLASEDIIVK